MQTGPDLLTHVQQAGAQVDLVVLDLRLPQGHGIESVKALRRIDTLTAPIVVFSGTIASADEVRELAALGVAGYVNEYTSVQHIVPSLAPHLFPDHYNRRSSPRVVLGIPVSYRFGNTIAAALTLNMSRGGLAVRTTSPLDVGTTLKVRFRLPDRQEGRRGRGARRLGRSAHRHGAAVHEDQHRRPEVDRRIRAGAFLHESKGLRSNAFAPRRRTG